MPDFSAILSKPLDSVKRPEALPQGSYFGSIKNYEPLESKDKKTPGIKFNCVLTHPGDDVDRAELTPEVGEINGKAVSHTFYLTDKSEYRLKEFLETLGVDTKGRTFQSTLPESVGKPVLIYLIKKANRDKPSDPLYNEVSSLAGVG